MAKKPGLDRKARVAVTAAAALLLAVPLFLIVKLATGGDSNMPGEAFRPDTAQLIVLRDGSTMLIKQHSRLKIAEWFTSNRKGEERFDVGNANFAPRSSNLTADGWEHVVQFAHLLETHPAVRAVVLFSAHAGDRSTIELEHQRADRISAEARKRGVDASQISVAPEAYEPGHNPAKDEGLEVVLTNRG